MTTSPPRAPRPEPDGEPPRGRVTSPSPAASPDMPVGLRSGELAAVTGVGIQTLRYYERRGLLPPADRSPGGHRVFPPAAVDRLRAIKAAQRLGFTLSEVTALLGAAAHGRGRPPAGFAARSQAKLAEVEARIADLQSTAETLRAAVRAGCDDLAVCAAEASCPIPFAAHTISTIGPEPGRRPAG